MATDDQRPTPDRIDLSDPAAVARWTSELDVSEAQLREALAAVGDLAGDVEMHLKGTRSSTNADRIDESGAR